VCYSVNIPPCEELLTYFVDLALLTRSFVEGGTSPAGIWILIYSHCEPSWAVNGRLFSQTEPRMGSSVAAF